MNRSLTRRTFLDAAAAGDLRVVDAWLRQPNGNVNATTGERWTALMYAVARGHVTIVERLLREPSIDLNATTLVGSSALALALEHRNSRMAVLLLQSGASRSTLTTEARLNARANSFLTDGLSRMLSADWSVVWSPAVHARFPPSEREKCRLVVFANHLARRQLHGPSSLEEMPLLAPLRLVASLFRRREAGGVRWTYLPPPLVLHIIEFAAFLW